MERGALILFEQNGSLWDKLIVFCTGGPYVHVEICLGEERLIGAHGNKRGIYERDWADLPSLVTQISLSSYADEEHIERALTWAQEQQGRSYGWMDIASQALKFLWPMTPIHLAQAGHYDCSEFAVRYMQQAGVILPSDYDTPSECSPNDVARVLKILPERPQRRRKRERERMKGHAIAAVATI